MSRIGLSVVFPAVGPGAGPRGDGGGRVGRELRRVVSVLAATALAALALAVAAPAPAVAQAPGDSELRRWLEVKAWRGSFSASYQQDTTSTNGDMTRKWRANASASGFGTTDSFMADGNLLHWHGVGAAHVTVKTVHTEEIRQGDASGGFRQTVTGSGSTGMGVETDPGFGVSINLEDGTYSVAFSTNGIPVKTRLEFFTGGHNRSPAPASPCPAPPGCGTARA
jgi:hypothetical protein